MSLSSPNPPALNGPALTKSALNEALSTPAPSLRVQSHLDRLEAESIHILREVAAGFRNPVMLYSVGKDSSVLLHLLLKAFYPARPPIPLLPRARAIHPQYGHGRFYRGPGGGAGGRTHGDAGIGSAGGGGRECQSVLESGGGGSL